MLRALNFTPTDQELEGLRAEYERNGNDTVVRICVSQLPCALTGSLKLRPHSLLTADIRRLYSHLHQGAQGTHAGSQCRAERSARHV